MPNGLDLGRLGDAYFRLQHLDEGVGAMRGRRPAGGAVHLKFAQDALVDVILATGIGRALAGRQSAQIVAVTIGDGGAGDGDRLEGDAAGVGDGDGNLGVTAGKEILKARLVAGEDQRRAGRRRPVLATPVVATPPWRRRSIAGRSVARPPSGPTRR